MVELLKSYLRELQEAHESLDHLCPEDFSPPPDIPMTDERAEQVARVADQYGFEGNTFRLLWWDFEPGTLQHKKWLARQIETLPKLIAAIEQTANKVTLPPEAALLNVHQVALILGWAEGTVRARDKAGLLPKPQKFGGTLQWNREDLQAWLEHNCPPRNAWERMQEGL